MDELRKKGVRLSSLMRAKPLPPSNKMNLKPGYLLSHQNHFDRNVYTPQDLMRKGVLRGKMGKRRFV